MGITSDNNTLNKHLSILVEAITSQIIVVVLENGYVYTIRILPLRYKMFCKRMIKIFLYLFTFSEKYIFKINHKVFVFEVSKICT